MTINQTRQDNRITIALAGRLDTITQEELAKELEGIFAAEQVDLVFEFSALDYISSAGLRVLLATQKKVNALGRTMKIVGAKSEIKEIFEVTGFAEIMVIE